MTNEQIQQYQTKWLEWDPAVTIEETSTISKPNEWIYTDPFGREFLAKGPKCCAVNHAIKFKFNMLKVIKQMVSA